MFLKRIEMNGFKSFADPITINFEHSVTGIVGPNGCGKSNITDAIRWVLGEQSVKSLRGDKMVDVIFQGSQDRRMQNLAEVTLVFDNTNHVLNSDLEEIEVTRRLYRQNGEAEYLINRNKVRLKDVVDLILDTGLARDSLSMISQGNIASFAEAKPFDRRAIFEEAAGVSKYKKRKIESINKLGRTSSNLERTLDILNELEKQVSPLKRQAKKALIYREKKEKLKEIEINVLVNEIESLKEDIEEIQASVFELETSSTLANTNIEVLENSNNENKQNANQLEREINNLQEKLMTIINNIQTLETRKIELEEKSKYIIEVGNNEEKAKQIEILMAEAKNEYEDRVSRYNKYEVEMDLASEKLKKLAFDLVNAMQKKDENYSFVRRLENKYEVIKNMMDQPFNNQQGVKSIMDHKDSLAGIIGVLGQIIKPFEGYEEALTSALGGAMYHIATKDEASARNAIDFLKKNKSGRATFLPIDVIKENHIREDHYIVLKETEGFIDLASNLIDYDPRIDRVIDALLDNIIVCDNLVNGNKIAKNVNYNYKIVTLDGDIINRGGSMSGGRSQNANASIITLEKQYHDVNEQLISYRAKQKLLENDYLDVLKAKQDIEKSVTEYRINMATLEPIVEAKKAKYDKLVADYQLLKPQQDVEVDFSYKDSIINELNEAYSSRDEITTSIKLKRSTRASLTDDIERKEQKIKQIRKELDVINHNERDIYAKKVQLETKLDNNLKRLASEYQMTFEYAKTKVKEVEEDVSVDEVNRLRQEIESLGNVNMNAPEEYDEVNERYEFIKSNYDELVASRDQLLKAINEMDHIMIKQFKDMFDLINSNLNETFSALFGGGKARLILEDPDDILNTGIDIDVQPPGKSVNINIKLLSGGEKTLIAFCVLFTILKVKPVPLVIFDEVDAALDQGNVERFSRYIKNFSEDTQFLIVTHRPGTMRECDVLYGVTMQKQGVSQMLKVELVDAMNIVDNKEE